MEACTTCVSKQFQTFTTLRDEAIYGTINDGCYEAELEQKLQVNVIYIIDYAKRAQQPL